MPAPRGGLGLDCEHNRAILVFATIDPTIGGMAMNIGLLVLRIVVGLLFVGHGAQKLFGVFGGYGIEGTGGFFEQIGLKPGKLHASAAGLMELGGGALLA